MHSSSTNVLALVALLAAILAILAGCASSEATIQSEPKAVTPSEPPQELLERRDVSDADSGSLATESTERPEQQPPEASIQSVELSEDLVVHMQEPAVEVLAWVCIDAGFLEQIACSPGTREHESLVVIREKPSNIHAALLLAGFEPGAPGRWLWNEDMPEGEQLKLIAPEGDLLDVFVRYQREDEIVEEPIRNWVRDFHDVDRKLPDQPWVFGGSLFRPNPEHMGPGEHYVADFSGSIIGLVTFGDEVIGFKEVISDQAAIHDPEWEVDIEAVPPMGTEVTIILRPRQ